MNEKLINQPDYGDFDADGNRKVDLQAGGADIDLSGLDGVLRVSGGETYANATLDHVREGATYGRVQGSSLTNGRVVRLHQAGGSYATVVLGGSNRVLTLAANVALNQNLRTTDSPVLTGLTIVNAINEFSIDGTLAGDSDSALPTEKAVKTYVDTQILAPLEAFKTIVPPAGANVVADAIEDTLNLTSGNAILTITGTAVSDTIDFTINEGSIDHDVLTNVHQDVTTSASPSFGGLTKVGDVTNYTEIKTNGEINLHGTARVINHVRVSAQSWKKGLSPPQEGSVGVVPVLKFDKATEEECHYLIECPFRMITGGTIEVVVDWCYEGGEDAGTVVWGMEFINLATGETVDGATTTIYATSAGSQASGKLIRTTLETGITGAVAEDDIGIRLFRNVDNSEDDLDTDTCMIEVHFHFVDDKLGQPT